MEIIKRIWNYFFGKKKQRTVIFEGKEVPVYDLPKRDEKIKILEPAPEYDRGKIIRYQTQAFRYQQLPGKIYNLGKSRFRIHDRISGGNKFKYHVEKLTSLL